VCIAIAIALVRSGRAILELECWTTADRRRPFGEGDDARRRAHATARDGRSVASATAPRPREHVFERFRVRDAA
jgi:hypothetical protein